MFKKSYGKDPETENIKAAPSDNPTKKKRRPALQQVIDEFARLETLSEDLRILKRIERFRAYLSSHGYKITKSE